MSAIAIKKPSQPYRGESLKLTALTLNSAKIPHKSEKGVKQKVYAQNILLKLNGFLSILILPNLTNLQSLFHRLQPRLSH